VVDGKTAKPGVSFRKHGGTSAEREQEMVMRCSTESATASGKDFARSARGQGGKIKPAQVEASPNRIKNKTGDEREATRDIVSGSRGGDVTPRAPTRGANPRKGARLSRGFGLRKWVYKSRSCDRTQQTFALEGGRVKL